MNLGKCVKHGNESGCDWVLTNDCDDFDAFVSKSVSQTLRNINENGAKKPISKNGLENVFGTGYGCDLVLTKGKMGDYEFPTNKLLFGNSIIEPKTLKSPKKSEINVQKVHFQNSLETKDDISLMGESFNCEICNYTTARKWSFNRHMRSKKHLKKCGVMCKTCEKQYESKSGLWKHNQRCHGKKTKPKKKHTH